MGKKRKKGGDQDVWERGERNSVELELI